MSRISSPNPREPWLDARTGQVSRYWLRFLNDLFREIGGSREASTVPAENVTPSLSPYTYTATSSGMLIVRGGMVRKIEYGRRSEFFSDGSTAGTYYISAGDQLRVTYDDAPSMTFIQV